MKFTIHVLIAVGLDFYFLCSSCFSQSRVNELSAGLAIVYFPDWKLAGEAWSAGGQYQRTLGTSFSLALAFQYGYGSIASNVNYADPVNLGITLDRSLYHADVSFGYKVLKNKSSTIS